MCTLTFGNEALSKMLWSILWVSITFSISCCKWHDRWLYPEKGHSKETKPNTSAYLQAKQMVVKCSFPKLFSEMGSEIQKPTFKLTYC